MITKRIPRKKSLNIINNFFFEDELKIIDDYLDDLFKDNNVLFPASKESLYIKGDMFKHHVSKNFDDEIYDIIITENYNVFNLIYRSYWINCIWQSINCTIMDYSMHISLR